MYLFAQERSTGWLAYEKEGGTTLCAKPAVSHSLDISMDGSVHGLR